MFIQEDYFKNIFNTVRDAILILDENMRVLSANRSFFNIFKVDSANTIGSLLYDLGNGQWNIPNLRVLLEDILPKNDTVDDYEIEHKFESIGQKNMLLNACKIVAKKNEPPIILLAIKDITERREIEKGLENTRKELEATKISEDEAREYAESIINTVREPLIALDQDLRVVTASRSFYEVFKVNPKETVGQLIYDLGNKQWDIPKLRELLETILPQKATFDNYEVEHDFSTIGRRIMLLNARQIKRVSGKERIILLAIEDITERKEIEKGLEKARKELEATKISEDEAREYAESIINTVREPLIALDQDLRVVSASRSFYEVFKVNPKETVGQLIYDLGNKQWDIPKLRELLETILPEKATFDNYEVEHDFSTIGRRIMLLNARQIKRVLGKERIILLAIEDITERKKLEQKINQYSKELERSNGELSNFGSIVAHDLGAPLRAVSGFAGLLQKRYKEKLAAEADEYISHIVEGTGRMQHLINDLLEYARVGTSSKPLIQVDVNIIIEQALANLMFEITESRAVIRADTLPTVSADDTRLIQLFQNLVGNAIKYRSNTPHIHISAERKDGEWLFRISDNGIGIEPRQFERIFQIFQRLHTRDEYSGTGIGLAICKKIVERLGGRIWVESKPGEGATFLFTLPATE